MRRILLTAAATFAFLSILTTAGNLRAQVPNEVQEAIRTSLTDSREVFLVMGSPIVASFTLLEPRLEMGRVVGRVRSAEVGQTETFDERSFPLDGVRELRVKRARWVEGLAYGAFLGLAVSGAMHVRCEAIEGCDGALGMKFGALYPLASLSLAVAMGGLAYAHPSWKTVYTRRPGNIFQTDSDVDAWRKPTTASSTAVPVPVRGER